MGLTMTGCSCGGKQVAPAINLCQVSPLGSTRCLRPAVVDVAHLRLPPRRSKFLKCLQMSILGRKDSPPLSLGLLTLQLHGATTTFPCCSGGDGGPKVREKGPTCLEVPRSLSQGEAPHRDSIRKHCASCELLGCVSTGGQLVCGDDQLHRHSRTETRNLPRGKGTGFLQQPPLL